ncbi:MAG: delta-60 repeat domain-containing protein [Gammaproteobacteria bacterium]|nr:delta-60 repeat domain-containing protein [Gammaproteobacteria bacterium]
MHRRIKGLARQILLPIVYGLGVAGILASGDGSNSGGIRYCDLVVRGIAPTTDGSNDVWIGVLAITSSGEVDRISRLASNGAERFGVDIATGNTDNAVRAIAIAVEGGAVDDLYVGGDFDEGILRLNDDGTLDGTFDANVGTGFDGRVTSIVPAADTTGDIYVGGNFTTYQGNPVGALVRLDDDGMLDAGFGGNGAIITNVESVAMEGGGTSDVYSGGTTAPAIERWNSSGTEDVTPDFITPGGIFPVFSIIPATDFPSDVYVGGGFAGRIIRLDDEGITVNTFAVGAGFDDDVFSIIDAGAANEIYAGGDFTTYQGNTARGLIRLDTVGAIVGSFNTGAGFDDPRDATSASQVASLALATPPSTDLFVGGGFTRYDGPDVNGLVRLNADGSLDTAFEVRIEANGQDCNNDSIRR